MTNLFVKPEETSKEEWLAPEVQLMQVSANTLDIPDPNSGGINGPD